jgi:Glycosyl transferases group 1
VNREAASRTAQRRYRVAWLTAHACPLQRAFLEAAAKHPGIDLDVVICGDGRGTRPWNWQERQGVYRHMVLRGVSGGGYVLNPGIVAHCLRSSYDLYIVTTYAQPTMQLAMIALSLAGRNWALWNERPGMNPDSMFRNLLRNLALQLPKRYAACAIGAGSVARDAFQRLLGDGRRAYSIPYFIDLESFLALPIPRPRAHIRFLFCGQLVPRKGIDTICECVESLLADGEQISLAIAGEGPERDRLEKLRARFPDRVTIHGFLSFERRIEAYRDADVFLFPSRYDGWEVAVHEAMARGMPVISSDAVGSAVELVEEGVSGFLIPRSDAARFCEKMRFFSQQPESISSFGEAARARAEIYTPEFGVRELLNVLSNVRGQNRNVIGSHVNLGPSNN